MKRADRPSSDEFGRMAELLRRVSGIYLPPTEKNRMLITNRLQRVLRKTGCDDYHQLLDRIDSDGSVLREFVSAMTTNTTKFFREADHFDFLIKAVHQDATRRGPSRGSLRVWSVPCSTGEEAYSLAATLESTGSDYRILATDIDPEVVAKAKAGRYRLDVYPDIPAAYRDTYFRVQGGAEVHVAATIREKITFGTFNLLKDYPFKQPFDVIFCRNVLIYFEPSNIRYVVSNLAQSLCEGGLLFLGHSEAGAGQSDGLERIGPSVFRRRKGA